jgi:dTDP-glucose 4,6-dehydratase
MNLLVTGGAGFIGSHFTKMAAAGDLGLDFKRITVVDKLTYAGKIENLEPLNLDSEIDFVEADISDVKIMDTLTSDANLVVNFAAESHVDRSIDSSQEFLASNVLGVGTLLEACRRNSVIRFLQVSTDEVYGTIEEGSWDEDFRLDPNSPYAASKAAADLLVQTFHRTHNLNTVITRCSNNYGSHQDVEKLIPKAITLALSGLKIPIYGDGKNIREWIHVKDHCRGIALALIKGEAGNIYNIGSGIELTNLDLVKTILELLNLSDDMIEFVEDRKGHDLRYSLNYEKIQNIGYEPQENLQEGLMETINWFAAKGH